MNRQNRLANYAKFTQAALKRLKQGEIEYGDESFSASPLLLIGEIEEELLDVVGWTFVLLERLEEVKRKMSAAQVEKMLVGVDND